MRSFVSSISFFVRPLPPCFFFFFFNDTATTEIYTLSLHDALPICEGILAVSPSGRHLMCSQCRRISLTKPSSTSGDRKSTRLNSSHGYISYAVFCLKKKKHINGPLLVHYTR